MGIPPAKIVGFRNSDGRNYTIRVDSKVVKETDTGQAKSAEDRWMRFTLDTVGRQDWPRDSQDRALYPEGFKELHEPHQGDQRAVAQDHHGGRTQSGGVALDTGVALVALAAMARRRNDLRGAERIHRASGGAPSGLP